jgi:glycosyltransferase involved in cell wall biosynthesis
LAVVKPKLSYFIVKVETYEIEAFLREAKKFDPNGVILVCNYGGEINVAQCPSDIPLKKQYFFFKSGSFGSSRWLKWPRFLAIVIWIMFKVCRYRQVEYCYMEGGDVIAWAAQIFKKLGWIHHTTNMIPDWSLPQAARGIGERINNFKLRLNDFLLTKMDTTVVVTPKPIFDMRNKYWEGKTLRNTVLYDNSWAWLIEKKIEKTQPGKYICFLGNLRKDFGVEILFKILPGLNQKYGFRLKVIAPETELYFYYKDLSVQMGVDRLIDWKGFIPLSQFPIEFADCFCGLNVQELEENTGRFVVSGRVVNYLQYLIVPIMSPTSGVLTDFLEKYQIGIICQPHSEAMEKAILEAFNNFSKYTSNIEQFLETNPYKRPFSNIIGIKRSN